MKSIVLLSGGLDSAVCLAKADLETEVALCLTFDYGQRAVEKEIEAAKNLTQYYRIHHKIIQLPFLKEITKTSLVNREEKVPLLNRNQLDDLEDTKITAAKVWVPNRNGLFINIAASWAESMDCQFIVTGFNREEATTFPDNSPEFINEINGSLAYSTQNGVKVISYTQSMNKVEIAGLGKALGLPFNLIWSCYHGESTMCGVCESCQRLARALEVNEIEIPFTQR